MHTFRLITAAAVVVLVNACSSSGTTGPQTGTVSGTISSSNGGGLAGLTVTVTPSGQSALGAVQTNSAGVYSVTNVPTGGGTVAVSGVPVGCSVPATSTYSGLTSNATQTVNFQITCPPPAATITGTVTSSATNAGIASVTITVTPTGQSALPAVQTNAQGQYTVNNVPAGSGQIAVSNVPTGCTIPTPGAYSISSGLTGTININVTCSSTTGATTTTLNVGQTALFTTTPAFATNLTIDPNGVYLLALVNTDTASSVMEDVELSGTFTASGASHVAPLRLATARSLKPPVRISLNALPRHNRVSAARPKLDPQLTRDLQFLRKAEQGHVARMDQEVRFLQQTRPRFGRQGSPIRTSLVGTNVGDVNPINIPGSNCSIQATIGARTVYVGQHVQVLADTSLTNWPAQYRPDSSYYTTFGQEYDTLTYNKHLLTYIGDPLQYDQRLSGVGKVTVVLTPQLNNYQLPGVSGGGTILAFVSGCDFFPPSQEPSSNLTEMFYHLVPSANYSVAFWERELRPTAAHESKHIVSFGVHLANAQFLEQIWLEEGLAQVSSEVWGRNYNFSTWKGDNGFLQTLGCEVTGGPPDPCNTPTSPYTFVESHMAWLEDYIQGIDSITQTLNGTTPGRYGAGWSIARWAIDQYTNGTSPTTEATMIQSLINNFNQNGLANLSTTTGASSEQILADWSLAVGLDTVSLLDSTTFNVGTIDPLATVPSYDFRNIFSIAGNGGLYALAAPLRPAILNAGPFTATATGIPGTYQVYAEIVGQGTAGTEALQLLSGSGGAISQSSGFRVAIIRIQ